jgi:hypothetical protein
MAGFSFAPLSALKGVLILSDEARRLEDRPSHSNLVIRHRRPPKGSESITFDEVEFSDQ